MGRGGRRAVVLIPTTTLVLLPGLDGTGRLFRPFLEVIDGVSTRVVSYPPDRVLSVDELADLVEGTLPSTGPVVLVAESFSGRVALEVARRRDPPIDALILVASFASNPTPFPDAMAAFLPEMAFAVPLPRWVLRSILLGTDAPDDLVDDLASALATVAPRVLSNRLREVLLRPPPPAASLTGLPAAYLRGTRDVLVGPRGLESLRATGAEVTVFDVDAPHLVLQRAPRAASEVVREFLGVRGL